MGDPVAEESKNDGNKCMKENKFIEAMFHYTKAIKIDPYIPTYYSNRSLAFLKMEQLYYALEDAEVVIRKMPSWVKGYYRKAEVLTKAEDYEAAIEAYNEGLAINPKEPSLLKALEEVKQKLRERRKAENRVPWYGLTLGVGLGVVLVLLDAATPTPTLSNEVFQFLTIALLGAVLCGMAWTYRYFNIKQRKALLEPPLDLNPEDQDAMGLGGNSQSKPTTQSREPGNQSSYHGAQQHNKGRQRKKQRS